MKKGSKKGELQPKSWFEKRIGKKVYRNGNEFRSSSVTIANKHQAKLMFDNQTEGHEYRDRP